MIGIYDETGTKVVEYIYNAWGEVTTKYLTTQSLTALYQNPFRYRGYYYDTITGFYYVSSRYYDPEIGRWLNADGYVSTGQGILSNNMFAYCENNSVNKIDPAGNFALTATLGGIALWKIGTAIIGAVTAFIVVDTIVKNPPTLPVISTPKIEAKPKSETKEKTEDIVSSRPRRDPVHHIVAKADFRAAESRKILMDVGIDPITDPRNLVILPQRYHALLHTAAYHNYVLERLRSVAGDKKGIEATLASIKAEILARLATGIRWD